MLYLWSMNNANNNKMKNLKFRVNQTKTQKANLTPSKVHNLKIINTFSDGGRLLYVVCNEKSNFVLGQWFDNDNEFSMRRLKDSVDASKYNLEMHNNNNDLLINKCTNGRITNFWKVN